MATSFRRQPYQYRFLLTLFLLFLSWQRQFYHISEAISNDFPPLSDVLENLILSGLMYLIDSCDDENIPPHITCHLYEHREHGDDSKEKRGTKAAVFSSSLKRYVAIAYAGTNNAYDVVTDAEIQMVPFGPHKHPINPDVRVHGGFNAAVFHGGLYQRLLEKVLGILSKHHGYRVMSTGHSLGAADSMLTGVAMALEFQHDDVHRSRHVDVINFGCPRTSNDDFRRWANDFNNLSIWRFVHLNDIIPRVPFPFWKHPGHTIQMYHEKSSAYYLHDGDDDLGYRGVPRFWQAAPFVEPTSGYHHILVTYARYIQNKSCRDPDTFYVDEFETVDKSLSLSEEEGTYEVGESYDFYHFGDDDNSEGSVCEIEYIFDEVFSDKGIEEEFDGFGGSRIALKKT